MRQTAFAARAISKTHCRAAYEYQKWNIDGLPTGGAGFGGTIGQLTTSSFASAGLGGMTLQGISIGTGLTWKQTKLKRTLLAAY